VDLEEVPRLVHSNGDSHVVLQDPGTNVVVFNIILHYLAVYDNWLWYMQKANILLGPGMSEGRMDKYKALHTCRKG